MMQWQGAIAEGRDPISQRDTAMWEGNLRVSHFDVPSFLKCQEEPCKNKMTGDDALVEILSVSPSCCFR
ncbi:hypothetical protein QQF64_014113 [Cirrhinus molitorella]|uniref:Uncharacterized protein n=1 Tax=Cirrhinus molitorella TaxID=172907 RepID=A0ABR3LT26_9TELE